MKTEQRIIIKYLLCVRQIDVSNDVLTVQLLLPKSILKNTLNAEDSRACLLYLTLLDVVVSLLT